MRLNIWIPIVGSIFIGLVLILLGNLALNLIGQATLITSIFSGMFVLLRDEQRRFHERSLHEEKQIFSLGAMSHMANMTFDKHIEFCEKYINQFIQILRSLFRDGATLKCLDYANNLAKIRDEYVLWVTDEINKPLIELEAAFRKMGANNYLLKSLPVSEKRTKVVDELFGLFSEICEIREDKNKSDEEKEVKSQIASSVIIQHLRQVLGAEDLVKLRKSLMNKAIDYPIKERKINKHQKHVRSIS